MMKKVSRLSVERGDLVLFFGLQKYWEYSWVLKPA